MPDHLFGAPLSEADYLNLERCGTSRATADAAPVTRVDDLTPSARNLTYRVELADGAASDDLALLFRERNAMDSPAAARWFNRLEPAVYLLEKRPFRCPVAGESRKDGAKAVHLRYGKKPQVDRVIYEIDEQRRTIRVLTIRQARRQPAGKSDFS